MPRKGENIYKRKDGRWEGRYVKGRDGKKAIYGYVYSKSYSEVKKQLILKRAEYALENNKPSVSTMKDALFSDLSEMWLRSIQSSVKESTWIKYRNILKCNVVPRLGNKNLSEIDYSVVSTFCNNLMESGGKDQSGLAAKTVADALSLTKAVIKYASRMKYVTDRTALDVSVKVKNAPLRVLSVQEQQILIANLAEELDFTELGIYICLFTGIRVGDDDDKIRLNQRKPSKYKGLSRFGPEKNLQRINKFMKERPIFYKNLIQMKENFRFYLRCFYCITKVVILQFNSENRTELARNG